MGLHTCVCGVITILLLTSHLLQTNCDTNLSVRWAVDINTRNIVTKAAEMPEVIVAECL